MNTKLFILFSAATLLSVGAWAETPPVQVTVAPHTQRYLGEVSELAREKYINMHTHPFYAVYSYEDVRMLREDLGIQFGRAFNGPFWYFPTKKALTTPFPSDAQAAALSRGFRDLIETQPNFALHDRRTIITDHPYEAFDMEMDTEAAAQWAVTFFKHFWSDAARPQFYEPMNEPFVHTKDYGTDHAAIRLKMSELFRDIGKAFDESGLDVKVFGYASAWPSMELWDFKHWRERMKLFMDVAGDYMDGFSIHLYDGTNVTGQDNRRSGANADAILDLIETYSMVKWGRVKPHAITEYGDIPKGYGDSYSDVKSAQNHRAYNHILFGLMERQDRLEHSIPFVTGKSPWHYEESGKLEAYGWDLWRPDPEQVVNGEVLGYKFTAKVPFFHLWKDVAGARTAATSSNPDLQVRSFADGKTLWICLNNLADEPLAAQLQTPSDHLPQTAHIRRLNVQPKEMLVYVDEALDAPLSQVNLAAYETVVLRYTYEQAIGFQQQVVAKTHYAPEHMQPVEANKEIVFHFNALPTHATKAHLRVSIGRNQSLSKQPQLSLNGHPIPFPSNWPGYDQANRTDFFGAIPVELPVEKLTSDSTVSLTFPDQGGYVSSVLLMTESPQTTP